MRNTVSLLVFLAITVGGGLAIGYLTAPGEWYAGLNKPFFNPPAFVFAPVWTALYVLIAIAGWRVWRRAPKSPAMALWAVQMGLNFLWSPVFFSAHRIDLALVVILALLVAIVAFIVAACRTDGKASWLFVPYAAWVAFATLLNAAIVVLN